MTTPAALEERARYASALINHAARIVAAVHDDGPDELVKAIRAALTVPHPADVDPIVALITTLGAMVDPSKRTSELLAWVRRFAGLAPLYPTGATTPTLQPSPTSVRCDSLRVERAVEHGATGDLTDLERDRAVWILTHRQWDTDRIAAHLGVPLEVVADARARLYLIDTPAPEAPVTEAVAA